MPQVHTVRQDGSRIREIRVRRGLTIPQLARKIGRWPQTLSNVELENRDVSLVMLNQIANALGVEPAELIRPDGNGSAA